MPTAGALNQHNRQLGIDMGDYSAQVRWECEGDFLAQRYSRAHEWVFDGGAVVSASAAPRNVAGPYADASAVDPEEALVAAAASCHMLWFLHLAAKAGWEVARYEDRAAGVLGKDERGKISVVSIRLSPVVTFRERAAGEEDLARLHRAAHESCFIANSLRGEVSISRSETRLIL